MSATNKGQARILNDYATNGHAALFTAVSSVPNGTVTEPSGGAYARVALDGKFPTATQSPVSNDTEIAFPEATASWGTVTHMGIYDAATDGDLLLVLPLNTPAAVTTGQIFKFAISQLTLTVN
jgi:hypothetical protein